MRAMCYNALRQPIREEVEGMGKKKARVPKSGPVWRQSSTEATLAKMPRYNGHACGTGPHGDTAYNRARSKRSWKNDPDIKGACNRRLPLF